MLTLNHLIQVVDTAKKKQTFKTTQLSCKTERNMYMSKTILIEALGIKNLKVNYPIYRKGTEVINTLQDAVNDGTLDKMLQESADKNCNGDKIVAVKAMKACLASYKTNTKNSIAAGRSIDKHIEDIRIETLSNFLNQYTTPASKNTKYAKVENGKAKYDVTKEEIDELVAGKTTKQELQELHKVLDSIYQCISSKITKDLQHASAAEPEKQAMYMRLSDVRDYITQTKANVRKQLDAASDTAAEVSGTISKKLTSKLLSGKSASLSKEETEALAEAIKSLGVKLS